MSPEVERMTGELAAMLADADRQKRIDPRTLPVRFSHLKAMGRSAAHCLESFQRDSDSTLAQRLGTGTHAMLFGPPVKLFDLPSKSGKGKAPRNGEAWEAFREANSGSCILIRSEYEQAVRMATAIRNNARAAALLFADGAKYEQTILWTEQGRARRSTPDVRTHRIVVEVKTTQSAKPEAFKWDVRKFAYHGQLADQCAAIEAETGKRPQEAFIVAVEKKPPHVVQTYRLTPRDLEQGERLRRAWFEALRVAEECNVWDGYHAGTVDLDLPDDQELEFDISDDAEDDAP